VRTSILPYLFLAALPVIAAQAAPETTALAELDLAGRSRVVTGDRYEFALRVPTGFKLKSAAVAGQTVEHATQGELVRVAWTPPATAEVEWTVSF
jgi:hypothetical protein